MFLHSIAHLENNDRKKETKCKIKQITDYFNFEYLRDGLLVHRSWNVGSGLLIPWSQLDRNRSLPTLTSKSIEGFSHVWVQTKESPDEQSMDVEDCDTQEELPVEMSRERKNLYECNAEQGCAAEFIKLGNLINHILVGKHRRVIEKFSLKDTAMKTYQSKLEEVENRRIISLDLNLTDNVEDEMSLPPKGWALPSA